MTRPVCRCHGEPMHKWGGDRGWSCAVKSRERQHRYYHANPEKAKARERARYNNDPEHAARKREAARAYRETPYGQLNSYLRNASRVRY